MQAAWVHVQLFAKQRSRTVLGSGLAAEGVWNGRSSSMHNVHTTAPSPGPVSRIGEGVCAFSRARSVTVTSIYQRYEGLRGKEDDRSVKTGMPHNTVT